MVGEGEEVRKRGEILTNQVIELKKDAHCRAFISPCPVTVTKWMPARSANTNAIGKRRERILLLHCSLQKIELHLWFYGQVYKRIRLTHAHKHRAGAAPNYNHVIKHMVTWHVHCTVWPTSHVIHLSSNISSSVNIICISPGRPKTATSHVRL